MFLHSFAIRLYIRNWIGILFLHLNISSNNRLNQDIDIMQNIENMYMCTHAYMHPYLYVRTLFDIVGHQLVCMVTIYDDMWYEVWHSPLSGSTTAKRHNSALSLKIIEKIGSKHNIKSSQNKAYYQHHWCG